MKRSELEAKQHIDRCFPSASQQGYSITSDYDKDYNCIAYAAGDNGNWWWPEPKDTFWPIPTREVTMDCFIEAFQTRGFEPCEGGDLEPGYEKIAIYANANREPSHAARQLPSGIWTSKLGTLEDIEHTNLQAIEGARYGYVAQFMRRTMRLTME
jgi:hypothetical protein